MRCPVYKSLDKPSAFFGIRGRFTTWMGILLGVDLFVSLLLGLLTVSFVGFLAFFVGAVAAYLYIMKIQGKGSDRAFSMKLNSKKYPQYLRTPVGAFRHMWREDRLP